MKKFLFLLLPIFGVLILGADRYSILSKSKMEDVTPRDGFGYFSGHFDAAETARNFVTMYAFKDFTDREPQIRIVGHNIDATLPLSRIDEAFRVFKALVHANFKDDDGKSGLDKLQEIHEILKNMERTPKK